MNWIPLLLQAQNGVNGGDDIAAAEANAALGFFQELRAERAMAALKAMAAPSATVVRSSEQLTVPAADLVPGDVVLLDAGRIVPADLRLVDVASLRVNESALTGESVPVDKVPASIADADAAVGDRINMAHKGTYKELQTIAPGATWRESWWVKPSGFTAAAPAAAPAVR